MQESVERFFYWMNERTLIQIKKDRGDPWPWTEDKILREFKFTNAFRENDKTTVWFRENIRGPLKDSSDVYMATIIFRWFNLIETGETLIAHNLIKEWDPKKAYEVITPQKKWITGAYMIKSPTGKNKVRGICQTITTVWNYRQGFLDKCPWQSIEKMTNYLEGYPFFGPFLAYEIATDLRHTYIGETANDLLTWANAGPGAMRGLNRIYDRPLEYTSKRHDWCKEMRELLQQSDEHFKYSSKYSNKFGLKDEHPNKLELREIEHSLCEFDKYERVRNGQGQPRSKYSPS